MRRSTTVIAALGLALLGSGAGARRRGGRALQPGAPVQARGEHPSRDRRVREGGRAAAGLRRRALHARQPLPRRRATTPGRPASTRRRSSSSPRTPTPTPTWARPTCGSSAPTRASASSRRRSTSSPTTTRRALSLGVAYKQKGDYKHAIEHLQKATELKPDDPQGVDQPRRRQVEDRRQGGRDRRAARRRSRSGRTTPSCTSTSAWSTGAQRNTDEAIAEYQVAVPEEPQAGQGLLRPGDPVLAGAEESRGAGGLREVPRVRHARGRRRAQGRRGAPEDLQGPPLPRGRAAAPPSRLAPSVSRPAPLGSSDGRGGGGERGHLPAVREKESSAANDRAACGLPAGRCASLPDTSASCGRTSAPLPIRCSVDDAVTPRVRAWRESAARLACATFRSGFCRRVACR